MISKVIRPAAGAAAICIFFIMLGIVLSDHSAGFDDPVRYFFYDLRNSSLTGFATVITHMADKYFLIAVCIVLLIIPKTRFSYGIPLSAGSLGIVILNSTLKRIVARPRPDVLHLVEESGYSFASGHSASSMFFYGMAIWLVHRHVETPWLRNTLMILLAIPMALIGPTRIYLGVHYPSDIVAGWCIGIVGIVIITTIIMKRDNGLCSKDRSVNSVPSIREEE